VAGIAAVYALVLHGFFWALAPATALGHDAAGVALCLNASDAAQDSAATPDPLGAPTAHPADHCVLCCAGPTHLPGVVSAPIRLVGAAERTLYPADECAPSVARHRAAQPRGPPLRA
jgi:hypothetical protein